MATKSKSEARHGVVRGIATGIAAALVAATISVGGVGAQQPAPPPKQPTQPPAQKKAAPAQPAPKQAAGQPEGGKQQSPWVKLCEKAPFAAKDKDGKDVQQERTICLTHHERLDGNTGMVLVSAAVREIEGMEKRHLMIMVPLGMAIPPGVGAVFAKNDDGKLAVAKDEKPIRLNYTLCHAAGCTAELEITPEIMKRMQAATKDEFLVVRSINVAAKTVDFPVPMFGFADALKGEPVNNEEYAKARRQLMEIIRARQAEVIEKASEVERKAAEDEKAKQQPPAAAPKAQPKKQ